MRKYKIWGCLSLICCSSVSLAMQPMDDQSLAATTGQDGIQLGIGLNTIQFNQLALIDNDGISASSDYRNRASWVLAGTNAKPMSLSFIGANQTPTLNLTTDINGNASGQSFANIAVTFAQHITGLTLSPFSIYLAGAASSSNTSGSKSIFSSNKINSDVNTLFRVDSTIDVNFVAGNAPRLNIQLGNTPQGKSILLGGAIRSVCSSGCLVTLVSDNTGASFNFSVQASDSTYGFLLDHFYAGIETDGVVVGNTGSSSKLDVNLAHMTFGTAGQSNANVFNGTKNGAIGNIGMVGASVSDLKIKVSGL